MISTNKQVVTDFMNMIWNNKQYDELCKFLHPNFEDHSLPTSLPPGAEGLKLWLTGLSNSFQHSSRIDDIIADDDKVAIRMTMLLKHTGQWRGIAATGKDFGTNGFRFFRLKDGKIIEHWGLLDATAIDNNIIAKP